MAPHGTQTMISDESAEKASDFLRDNAEEAGRLRGARIYAEEYRKHLKAILMTEIAEQPIGAQERHAYAHVRYADHLNNMRDAVIKGETNKALREAAVMRIETWRSWSANVRGKL